MKKTSRLNPCEICGASTAAHEGACFTRGEEIRFLCTRCFNQAIAEEEGLDFHHERLHHITLKDRDDESHTFHFQTRLFGDHVTIEAVEIQDDEPHGYRDTREPWRIRDRIIIAEYRTKGETSWVG